MPLLILYNEASLLHTFSKVWDKLPTFACKNYLLYVISMCISLQPIKHPINTPTCATHDLTNLPDIRTRIVGGQWRHKITSILVYGNGLSVNIHMAYMDTFIWTCAFCANSKLSIFHILDIFWLWARFSTLKVHLITSRLNCYWESPFFKLQL